MTTVDVFVKYGLQFLEPMLREGTVPRHAIITDLETIYHDVYILDRRDLPDHWYKFIEKIEETIGKDKPIRKRNLPSWF